MKRNPNPMKSTGKAPQMPTGFLAQGILSDSTDPELRHQLIQTAAYYRAEKRGFDGGDARET